MKRLLFVLLLSFALGCGSSVTPPAVSSDAPAPAPAPAAEEPSQPSEPQKIEWLNTFDDDTFKRAQEENKSIFIYLKDSQCDFCEQFDEMTLSNEVIIDLLQSGYLSIAIDIRANPEVVPTFYNKGEDISVPRLVFVKQKSNNDLMIARADGYHNVFEMLELLVAVDAFFVEQLTEADVKKESVK